MGIFDAHALPPLFMKISIAYFIIQSINPATKRLQGTGRNHNLWFSSLPWHSNLDMHPQLYNFQISPAIANMRVNHIN